MKYSDIKKQPLDACCLSEDAEAVAVDYRYVEALIKILATGTSKAGSNISASNAILILGTVGSPTLAKHYYHPYKRKIVTPDGRTIFDNNTDAAGQFDPNTGQVSLADKTLQNIINGTPSTYDSDTVVHELLHRGFAVIDKIIRRGDKAGRALAQRLPSDLMGKWRDGWGVYQFNGSYNERWPSNEWGGEIQATPEHAMIYSTTSSDHGSYVKAFVWEFSTRHPAARRHFTKEFYDTFNDNYDDMTREEWPATRHAVLVTYWKILLYQTSLAVRSWMREVLGADIGEYAPGTPPRPMPRPDRGGDTRDSDGDLGRAMPSDVEDKINKLELLLRQPWITDKKRQEILQLINILRMRNR